MNEVKVWDRDEIVTLLQKSDETLARAVLVLYARQTADEKCKSTTVEHNGRGFNAKDAGFLSSIARALPRYGNRLTYKQAVIVRKMVPKYWRQLLEEIELKGGRVSYGTKSLKSDVAKSAIIDTKAPEPVPEMLRNWGIW